MPPAPSPVLYFQQTAVQQENTPARFRNLPSANPGIADITINLNQKPTPAPKAPRVEQLSLSVSDHTTNNKSSKTAAASKNTVQTPSTSQIRRLPELKNDEYDTSDFCREKHNTLEALAGVGKVPASLFR